MLFDPSSDAAGYLHEAAQCEQAARRCMSPDNREAYLRLARQWRTLAKDAGYEPSRAANNDHKSIANAEREYRSGVRIRS